MDVSRAYDIYSIFNAIGVISENKYTKHDTKKATPFRRKPLKGLWHKHISDASNIPLNLKSEWKKGKNFEQAYNRALKNSNLKYGDEITTEFVDYLTCELIDKAYFKRSKEIRLTGHWLVYLPFKNRNYYLTLGHHKLEELTYQNVQNCFQDFPEVKEYLDSIK